MTGNTASLSDVGRQECPQLFCQVFESPCLAEQLLNLA